MGQYLTHLTSSPFFISNGVKGGLDDRYFGFFQSGMSQTTINNPSSYPINPISTHHQQNLTGVASAGHGSALSAHNHNDVDHNSNLLYPLLASNLPQIQLSLQQPIFGPVGSKNTPQQTQNGINDASLPQNDPQRFYTLPPSHPDFLKRFPTLSSSNTAGHLTPALSNTHIIASFSSKLILLSHLIVISYQYLTALVLYTKPSLQQRKYYTTSLESLIALLQRTILYFDLLCEENAYLPSQYPLLIVPHYSSHSLFHIKTVFTKVLNAQITHSPSYFTFLSPLTAFDVQITSYFPQRVVVSSISFIFTDSNYNFTIFHDKNGKNGKMLVILRG